ncbi:Quinone oxidoreductase 1 [Posidoniimonas polymericola]|uniref:Quinone oxidoreductase 1 n=1 Tax=Posidoniimonas polymericola TaxID=2528002 RepID=A0A5C5ZER3_9BACT|nr:NADPH:quinone reductase [Posidoniimonas polymericola]TWT85812.1 Quinone oxidoreductase 1 [Posidoniimonas polymericola]
MKAAFVQQAGPAESIQVGELPEPQPGPGDALVRVKVAAVNPIDTYVRGGMIAMDLPKPFVPGCDLAGEVVRSGGGLRPGQRVWCSNQGLLGRQGTLCELTAVNEHWLYPIPDGVTDEAAAAGALVGITAHLGLVREARLASGETILVNGGSGGVGSTVVQMAKALGATVIATAGTEEKRQACRDLGADVAVDYKVKDLAEALAAEVPSFGGVNVWWETTREPDFDRILSCLADRGRIVLMAGRDARPEFPVGPFYVKGASLHGFVMFKATPDEQREAADSINAWLASGEYRPKVSHTFTLDQAAAAHRMQEDNTLHGTGELAGKIVVRIG